MQTGQTESTVFVGHLIKDPDTEGVFYNRGFSDSDSDPDEEGVTNSEESDDSSSSGTVDFRDTAHREGVQQMPTRNNLSYHDIIVENDDTNGFSSGPVRMIPNIRITDVGTENVADFMEYTTDNTARRVSKDEDISYRNYHVQLTEPFKQTSAELIVEEDGVTAEPVSRHIPNIRINDVDIEDDVTEVTGDVTVDEDGEDTDDGLAMLNFKHKISKPPVRNFSEVFTKRTHPAERMSSVPNMRTNNGLTATRSSLSRQGSYIQDAPRGSIQTNVASSTDSDAFLQSSTFDEERSKSLNTLLEASQRLLQKHKTKANLLKLNIRSNAYDKAYEILKDRNLVYITGKLGSGKTHTALDIISSFTEEFENFKPLFIRSPMDLALLENTPMCLIVFADNFVVNDNHQISTVTAWRHVMKYVIPLMARKRICFIFTSQLNVTDEFVHQTHSFHGMLDNQSLINLDDDSFKFSDKQMNKMLTAYSKHFCKPLYTHPKEIEEYVLSHDNSFGFPLICNLVGIGGSSELFSNPYAALCFFVAEQHDHHFPSYFLLVLVLISGKDCSLLRFQHENQSKFEKLSDILKNPKCTYSEVSVGLTRLKRQNVLFEEESGAISFTHESIGVAVFSHVLTICSHAEIVELLPVEVINRLMILPDNDSLSRDGHAIKDQIESSTEALRAFAANFSNVLDLKQPEDFLEVSSSNLWAFETFVDSVFAVFGCQFFFIEDLNKTPLSSYFIRLGKDTVIFRVVDFMRSQPQQIITMSKYAIDKTKEEACRFNETDIFLCLHSLFGSSHPSLVQAAIEGCNVDLLEKTLDRHTHELLPVSREMMQLACKNGNIDVVKYLFNKIETRHGSQVSKLLEMRRQNIKGETLLHYAALGGDVAVFDFLLDQRCDPQSRTHEGNSVLHIAAMFGRIQMVRLICSRFPELLRERNKFGFTCVHMAAREGHDDVLQILVARESNITDKVNGGNTILHIAAATGQAEIIRYIQLVNPLQQYTCNSNNFLPIHLAIKDGSIEALKQFLNNGCDIGIKTIDKRSLLHLAAFYGKLEVVRFLCVSKPELLKEVDIEGNTVSHDAAAGGNISVLKYLTEKGVDPYAQNKFKTTVLHEATFHGHTEMVKYLYDKYPSLLGIVNTNGYTVCFGAALSGNLEVLKFLVENGADPLYASSEGSTILHEAAFAGRLETVEYLCTNFPELKDVRNNKTYMPCHFAAQEGKLEVLDVLLTGETEPKPTTAEQTMLHIAAYNGMLPIVKYLCKKYPAIIPCLDKELATALHYAARGGHKEILQYLIDKGLDPGSTTTTGSTILHLAAYDGNTDMVIYLCSNFPQLIQCVDTSGYNAAHYGAGSGEVPLLLNILKYGLDPLARSNNGSTMLLKAAYNCKIEMVNYLCSEYPELISIADNYDCNVLHYSACAGSIELVQSLVDVGVDHEAKTKDGHTMLHVAAFHGQAKLVKYICQTYPELIDERDIDGKTAYETAIKHKTTEVVKILSSFQESDDLTDTYSSTGVLTEILCCDGMNIGDQILHVLGRIMCCCRR